MKSFLFFSFFASFFRFIFCTLGRWNAKCWLFHLAHKCCWKGEKKILSSLRLFCAVLFQEALCWWNLCVLLSIFIYAVCLVIISQNFEYFHKKLREYQWMEGCCEIFFVFLLVLRNFISKLCYECVGRNRWLVW